MVFSIVGGFPKLGVAFVGPYSMECSMLGSTLGFPHFGRLPSPFHGSFFSGFVLFGVREEFTGVEGHQIRSPPCPKAIRGLGVSGLGI